MTSADSRLARRFGATLKEQRRRRRWSQAELAERLDVSVDFVSLLERGLRLPSVGLLAAAASLFGIAVDAMLGGPTSDEWAEDAMRMLRAVPSEHRPTVMAVLRALSNERGG